MNRLLEDIVEHFKNTVLNQNASVVVVEGLAPRRPGLELLNERIAKALDAQVILGTKPPRPCDAPMEELQATVDRAKNVYSERRVVGCT